MHNRMGSRAMLLIVAVVAITAASTQLKADTGMCGGVNITLPFVDVPAGNTFFCSIAEAYFSALANGTDATHYSPSTNVPREQMAAFVTRTLDQSLKRGSRRASLKQWWTPTSVESLSMTTVGLDPLLVESDGADLWVSNQQSGSVSRVRASDGKVLETWTGATNAFGVLVAKGRIFIAGKPNSGPGKLYQIDPKQTAGAVTTLTSSMGVGPAGIAFDGARIWTANQGEFPGTPGSVSIVSFNPLTVLTITTGFNIPNGILYDGANIWVTDLGTQTIDKLDVSGNIIQSVPVGIGPSFPVFDGTNIWVPNGIASQSVSVVRAATGTVLATLTGNGLNDPNTAAFDGERILVTNYSGNSVSLWKASDLTPLGSVSTGVASQVQGACSDGLNFWVVLSQAGKLMRF